MQPPQTTQPQPPLLPSAIPQFVVINDQMQQSWKHPIVHYVFEDESFPNISKDNCVLVDFDKDGENVREVYSLSHRFQVTDFKVSLTPQFGSAATSGSQIGVTGQSGGKEAASLMLTIEGFSAESIVDKIPTDLYDNDGEHSSNTFGLDELLGEFKRRNELLRQTLGHSEDSGD